MRADSRVGRVVAAVARRTPAFSPIREGSGSFARFARGLARDTAAFTPRTDSFLCTREVHSIGENHGVVVADVSGRSRLPHGAPLHFRRAVTRGRRCVRW